MMTSTSKVFSTEASSRAIEKMIQIWADKGYLKRLPFETLYRIVRFYRIIDQPSEVCRKNIAYGTMGRELA
jgi:alkylation response protein AidB-like acyl-CoA dehydrogenase